MLLTTNIYKLPQEQPRDCEKIDEYQRYPGGVARNWVSGGPPTMSVTCGQQYRTHPQKIKLFEAARVTKIMPTDHGGRSVIRLLVENIGFCAEGWKRPMNHTIDQVPS